MVFVKRLRAAGVRRRCRLWLGATTDTVLLIQGVDDLAGKAFTHSRCEFCQPVPDPAPAGMAEGCGVGQVRSRSNTAGLFVGDLDGSQRVRHGAGDCCREKSIMLDGEHYEGL